MYDIKWEELDGTQTLDDGDVITVQEVATGEIPSNMVGIELRIQGPTWWKAVQVPGHFFVEVQDQSTWASRIVPYADLKALILWKAKVFGIHTPVYSLVNPTEHMKTGNLYRFTWTKD